MRGRTNQDLLRYKAEEGRDSVEKQEEFERNHRRNYSKKIPERHLYGVKRRLIRVGNRKRLQKGQTEKGATSMDEKDRGEGKNKLQRLTRKGLVGNVRKKELLRAVGST